MIYDKHAVMLQKEDDMTIYKVNDSDGDVIMTAYQVFPGIELVYNDVHASMYMMNRDSASSLMEINHCREGRIEYQYGKDYYFLAPGDMSVSGNNRFWGAASFPTGHYHGITVNIDPVKAPECLSCVLQDVNVCPGILAAKFCMRSSYFSARSSARVEHVFSELYNVPVEVRKGYFKVKILELLLFLSALPEMEQQPSYTKSQVKLAKAVSDYLLSNTEGKLTISEISERLGASPTLINTSFRGVYGMTPGAFLRAQKMHSAAELLRNTDRTVLDIASQFGYDNGSKFAKAFRDIIGVSPNSYRCGADSDSCAPYDKKE